MKVKETGSDRAAEAHIIRTKTEHPCDEFSEYVAADGALCCVVGLDVDEQIAIQCGFEGSTTSLQFDVLVDGVLRNMKTHNSKAVRRHDKNEIFDHVLVHHNPALREALLKVGPLRDGIQVQEGSGPSVGTIEIRISVLRRAGESHILTDVNHFLEVKDWVEKPLNQVQYSILPPTYEIKLVEDGLKDLSKSQRQARIKQAKNPRPGFAPWAVFRFFYRSKDSIAQNRLPLTFDNYSMPGKPHVLQIEPVPDFPASLKLDLDVKLHTDKRLDTDEKFDINNESVSEGCPSLLSTPAIIQLAQESSCGPKPDPAEKGKKAPWKKALSVPSTSKTDNRAATMPPIIEDTIRVAPLVEVRAMSQIPHSKNETMSSTKEPHGDPIPFPAAPADSVEYGGASKAVELVSDPKAASTKLNNEASEGTLDITNRTDTSAADEIVHTKGLLRNSSTNTDVKDIANSILNGDSSHKESEEGRPVQHVEIKNGAHNGNEAQNGNGAHNSNGAQNGNESNTDSSETVSSEDGAGDSKKVYETQAAPQNHPIQNGPIENGHAENSPTPNGLVRNETPQNESVWNSQRSNKHGDIRTVDDKGDAAIQNSAPAKIVNGDISKSPFSNGLTTTNPTATPSTNHKRPNLDTTPALGPMPSPYPVPKRLKQFPATPLQSDLLSNQLQAARKKLEEQRVKRAAAQKKSQAAEARLVEARRRELERVQREIEEEKT